MRHGTQSHRICQRGSDPDGALFTLCALLLALAPEAGYGIFSFLFHVNLASVTYPVGWIVYMGELLVWTLGMWIAAVGFAWNYNRLQRE